ncbi:MAG: dihydrofolate reductase [Bacteroidales bacterium]|nr:dihydrofolate reductase [Bacteroidales bacterium]MBD5206331.1 dihydrofolate reductase [Bacteroidales bacterium]MBD5223929.1 dihydrofolate reductase [Bacteroidales bacterium]
MKKIIPTLIITTMAGLHAQAAVDPNFNYKVDRFADIEVLRYEVPEFDRLTPEQRIMLYYLGQAAQSGRDIIWDQNGKYNLQIRQLLEKIYTNYQGNRDTADFKNFETYLKQVWFGNGIHHHYSTDKFTPAFSKEFFQTEVAKLPVESLPLEAGETPQQMIEKLTEVIFNPAVMAKRVNQDGTQDVVATSAGNFYGEGVTQAEVEQYFNALKDPNDETPISYGLNSKIVKNPDGSLKEEVYCLNGLYAPAISKIIYWLDKAKDVAENDAQKAHITALIDYYITGDLRKFDEYSILWAEDTQSDVDFVNGFIESYGDPLGMTGSWESYVNFRNNASSQRTKTISDNAQWFEDNSPVDKRFKKEKVKGVSAKVINASMLAGDAYPATAIGINLPNSNWIRAQHGSKSVTIENITEAYDMASHGNGFNKEFVIDEATSDHMDKYLYITDMLHTDLHECLGHASGKLLPGVDQDALKENGSALEEARADLFALYYLADPKLLELGILDNPNAYQAEYYKYMLNGLMTQLNRIELGNNIEEAHMRNRQLIAQWALENGKKKGHGGKDVVELVKKGGKTFVKINDYPALRNLFGTLLSEIQRIKSEGDYKAGNDLIQKYAVKIDPKLHKEVIERYSTLDIPPYRGFINPVYTPILNDKGEITDVTISWPENYVEQMLRLSRDFSTLTK